MVWDGKRGMVMLWYDHEYEYDYGKAIGKADVLCVIYRSTGWLDETGRYGRWEGAHTFLFGILENVSYSPLYLRVHVSFEDEIDDGNSEVEMETDNLDPTPFSVFL